MYFDSIAGCCSEFLKSLPNPELPFIPALILGSLCSLIFILMLYKRHYKISMWQSLLQLIKDIFYTIPETEHSEFMKCNIESCIRCQRSEELKLFVIEEWKKMDVPDKDIVYPRISESVRKLSSKLNSEKLKKEEKSYKKKKSINQKPTIFEMDLPSNPIWTDLDCFFIEKELLKVNAKIIHEEYSKLLETFHNGNYQGWKLHHIPSGHWCIFPFIDQGKVIDENCAKCPNTTMLLSRFPSLMKNCVFGNACFSLLFPDSHIERHYGPSNMRLRCHYGLNIPQDAWLEVDGQQHKWKEGESIIFDDSYEHSAYFGPNRENEKPRAVLLVDFWHPSVSDAEKSVLLQLFKSDFVHD